MHIRLFAYNDANWYVDVVHDDDNSFRMLRVFPTQQEASDYISELQSAQVIEEQRPGPYPES